MIGRRVAAALAAALAWQLPAEVVSTAEPSTELVARGKYVFATAGGCACHTLADGAGLNAGGTKFDLFIGVVYARNITPDAETGIGKWTDLQVTNAIRRGERPDGSKLFPIHPYKNLGNISDDEIEALVAYLKSVKPVKSAVPPRSLKIPVPALTVPSAPKTAPRDGLARGAYLAAGAGHCTECHTPRRFDFSPDDAKFLAGGPGPQRTLAANITPHIDTGIGRWTEAQIARFMRTGVKPSGQEASSLMKTVIVGTSAGFKDLTEADAAAIARYLKTVPPIENKVR
ncbi:MAG: c-type cytochrome [Candidatus Rokuibacteriota bacterium]